jgi:hypothetical protein
MKIRITSVTAPGVSEQIRNITTVFEDRLQSDFVNKSFDGIEQFSVFYIVVDSDPSGNALYCKMHNKSGKYKDIATGKMISYVGIAIPIDPDLILKLPAENLRRHLWELLLKQLEEPPYLLPKNFNVQRLLNDLKNQSTAILFSR